MNFKWMKWTALCLLLVQSFEASATMMSEGRLVAAGAAITKIRVSETITDLRTGVSAAEAMKRISGMYVSSQDKAYWKKFLGQNKISPKDMVRFSSVTERAGGYELVMSGQKVFLETDPQHPGMVKVNGREVNFDAPPAEMLAQLKAAVGEKHGSRLWDLLVPTAQAGLEGPAILFIGIVLIGIVAQGISATKKAINPYTVPEYFRDLLVTCRNEKNNPLIKFENSSSFKMLEQLKKADVIDLKAGPKPKDCETFARKVIVQSNERVDVVGDPKAACDMATAFVTCLQGFEAQSKAVFDKSDVGGNGSSLTPAL